MKILILTPINPVDVGPAYARIANYFQENKKVEVLSIPVLAEIQARMEDKEYVANLFAMLKGSEIQKAKYRLYLNDYTIMIGNLYKSHKFDFVISLDYDEDSDLPFDLYLNELLMNPNAAEFAELARIYDLYTPADAEFNVPTVEHAIKFIEEVIKNNELSKKERRDAIKRKTKKGS